MRVLSAFTWLFFLSVLSVSCGDQLATIMKLVPSRYDRLKKWSDGETDVFMFIHTPHPHGTHEIRLVVSSEEKVRVYYRANSNSGPHYSKELEPVEQVGDTIKVYDFTKDFTRTSCWFALDFEKNGEIVKALTNSFNGEFEKFE